MRRSLLFGLLLVSLGGISAQEERDWDDCRDGLETLQKAASEAFDEASEAIETNEDAEEAANSDLVAQSAMVNVAHASPRRRCSQRSAHPHRRSSSGPHGAIPDGVEIAVRICPFSVKPDS